MRALASLTEAFAAGESSLALLREALALVAEIAGGSAACLLVSSDVLVALGDGKQATRGIIELGDGARLVQRGEEADEIRDWIGSSAPMTSLEGLRLVLPCRSSGMLILDPACGALADQARASLLRALGDLAVGIAGMAAKLAEAELKAAALEETRARFREQNLLLRELAVVDELTGLHNRRFFDRRLQYELDRLVRYQGHLSLILMDIDHFKLINDTHGHPMGDAVLKMLSAMALTMVRRVDLLARIGGEEFALLMPNTDRQGALTVATRILDRIATTDFELEEVTIRLTISMGIASVGDGWRGDPAKFFRSADQALYRAKHEGRNRAILAE